MSKSKTSPTSMIKFLRMVQSCTAALTDGERLVLWALAIEADYKTGRNSHPGNMKLMRVTGRKSAQGVLHIIRGLLAKGLIEKIREGHAKREGQDAQAAWYRICLEHPAFPDPEIMKAQTFTISESENQIVKAESADHESKQPPIMKVEGADHESLDFHSPINLSHKSIPQSLPESLDGLTDSFRKRTGRVMIFSAKQKVTVGRAIREHGRDIVEEAVVLFAQDGNDWEKIKFPSALFLAKLPDYLQGAADQVRHRRLMAENEAANQQIRAFDEYMAGVRYSPEWIERAEDWLKNNSPNPTADYMVRRRIGVVKDLLRRKAKHDYQREHEHELFG